MLCISSSPKKAIFCLSAILAAGAFATPAMAAAASSVVSYDHGTFSTAESHLTAYSTQNAAVGLPTADTGFGYILNPFLAPWNSSDVIAVGAGGHITLQLSSTVSNQTGADIGVFTLTSLVAQMNGSTITSTSDAAITSNAHNKAIVYVGASLDDMRALNDGNPIDLSMITNAYSDTTVYQDEWGYLATNAGTHESDYSKPFTGSLADFADMTYEQMSALLNGSAGGYWLDFSSTGLESIQYISFVVPTGADYRLILDAVSSVSAVPEPASAALLAIGAAAILRRRR